jgi:hypothetical protein
MNVISDQQVDFMYNDLNRRGLTIQELADELVDHIYCTIEDEVCRGTSFEVAYNNLVNNLDSNIFQNIQHQTLLSIDLKFQSMKKSMFVFGAFGTVALLAGVLMKNWHLPGAGVVLFLGTLCVVFGFLPLFFYTSYKEQPENRNVLLSVVGYFTAAFLILGSLFRIQHWPGAGIVMTSGQILLIVAFLPLYLVNVFKKAGETHTNIIYIIVIVVIGIATLYMSSSVRLSYEIGERYLALNSAYQRSAFMVKKSIDSLLQVKTIPMQDRNKIASCNSLKNSAEAINKSIDDLTGAMGLKINPLATINNFSQKDDEQIFGKVILINNADAKLLAEIQKLRTDALNLLKDELQKQKLYALLDFEEFTEMVKRQDYQKLPLMVGISQLSKIKRNVNIAVFETLKALE